ncbi:MAG: hypothetical protein QGH76_08300 [Phycisphaerales bacterium]|nr:hypothetical protein [Phycisphaerales bacterium]
MTPRTWLRQHAENPTAIPSMFERSLGPEVLELRSSTKRIAQLNLGPWCNR